MSKKKQQQQQQQQQHKRYRVARGNTIIGANGKWLTGEVSPKDLNEMISEKGEKCLLMLEEF